jgi:RNA polymerase-binding transcription factor DksA
VTFQHKESDLPEREKLTDKNDVATEAETNARDAALDEIRRRVKPQQSPRADGTYEFTDCDDCGNEIGDGRLRAAANNLWCVHCATRRERAKR